MWVWGDAGVVCEKYIIVCMMTISELLLGLDFFLNVDFVKRRVLSLVGEIQRCTNDRYYYH